LAPLLGGLTAVAALAGGVAWWVTTPKLSEVRHLQARQDGVALIAMFKAHAVDDRHPLVMTACAKAVLDLGRSSADGGLAALLSDHRLTLRNRRTIIAQFEAHERLVPRCVDLVVSNTLEAPLREALEEETLQIDSKAFERRVVSELDAAWRGGTQAPDAAIAAITASQKFDVQGTMGPRITNDLYRAQEAKLKRLNFPTDEAAIEAVSDVLRGLDCPRRQADRSKLNQLAVQLSRVHDKERFIASLEAKASSERENAVSLESDAAAAASELEGVYEITAFLIDRATYDSDDTYEISFNMFSATDRALLKTTETSFTSKGRFSMYVKKLRNETISLRGGGSAVWPVLEEFPRGGALRLRASSAQVAAMAARSRAEEVEGSLSVERDALSALVPGVNRSIQRM
jgi:hypothetical protein